MTCPARPTGCGVTREDDGAAVGRPHLTRARVQRAYQLHLHASNVLVSSRAMDFALTRGVWRQDGPLGRHASVVMRRAITVARNPTIRWSRVASVFITWSSSVASALADHHLPPAAPAPPRRRLRRLDREGSSASPILLQLPQIATDSGGLELPAVCCVVGSRGGAAAGCIITLIWADLRHSTRKTRRSGETRRKKLCSLTLV